MAKIKSTMMTIPPIRNSSTLTTWKMRGSGDRLVNMSTIDLKSNVKGTNAGARGDFLHLPLVRMRPIRAVLDSLIDKIEQDDPFVRPVAPLEFEFTSEKCLRLNQANGGPEHRLACYASSSATFVVPSSSLLTLKHGDDDNIHQMNHTNTSEPLSVTVDIASNEGIHEQREVWLKKHWLSVTIVLGIVLISIVTITASILV